jgi:hypothetical protein
VGVRVGAEEGSYCTNREKIALKNAVIYSLVVGLRII